MRDLLSYGFTTECNRLLHFKARKRFAEMHSSLKRNPGDGKEQLLEVPSTSRMSGQFRITMRISECRKSQSL